MRNTAARRALHQLIAERLQALSAPERALVECAAFIAYRVDPAIVAACTGMTRESADAVLRRACDLDLLIADQRNPGRYRFRHALVRAAVDELADDEQAKSAHVRIASVLERLPGAASQAGQLARLWARAGDRRKARAFARAAALEAHTLGLVEETPDPRA